MHGQFKQVQHMQHNQKATQEELLSKAYQLQCQLKQAQRLSSHPDSKPSSSPPKKMITQRIAEWEHQLQEEYSLTANRTDKEVPFPGTQFDDIPMVYIMLCYVMLFIYTFIHLYYILNLFISNYFTMQIRMKMILKSCTPLIHLNIILTHVVQHYLGLMTYPTSMKLSLTIMLVYFCFEIFQ